MFGLLRLAFGAAAKRGAVAAAERGTVATAERGFLGRMFGFAGKHPVMTTGAAVVADQKLNDGKGTKAVAKAAFNAVAPNSAADWIKYGAFGLATLSLISGNMMGAATFAAAGYYMNDILGSETFQHVMEAIDKFSNEALNIDIPDNWYKQFAKTTDASSAPVSAPAAPAMG